MNVRIRCDGCGKQIAVDEAFVGGVCRCPYCTALVHIEGRVAADREGARPQAPEREGARPETLGRRPAPPPVETLIPPRSQEELAARAARQHHVPTASPVKVWGMVAIIMAALLVAIVTVAIVLAVRSGQFGRPDQPKKPDKPLGDQPAVKPVSPPPPPATKPAPEEPAGPAAVAGDIMIDPPVIYCIEAGPGKPRQRSGVMVLLTDSIRTLGTKGRFDVAACCGGKAQFLDGVLYRKGGSRAAAAAEKFLAGLPATGAVPMADAIRQAVKSKPATVVVLAWSAFDPGDAAGQAKADGVKIVTVGVMAEAAAAQALRQLADRTGGQCRILDEQEMKAFAEQADKARAERGSP
jgi:hypothetical protein